MRKNGWSYYNHAMIPDTPPHEDVDISVLDSKTFWQANKSALLARWTSDFDCGFETNWWYVIKDTAFDISQIKAKRRYEINKGNKYFRVEIINPEDYGEELYAVQIAAFSAYPRKYRPTVNKSSFLRDLNTWRCFTVFASFYRDTGEMAGYALLLQEQYNCVHFKVLKTKPEFERLAVNASLVAEILNYYNDFLLKDGYICDGARSMNHETRFQDYLEKYFGFRKAYCKLHIKYNPKIKWICKVLYIFRKPLRVFDFIGVLHQINAVMKMEELVRDEK